jgi:alpha-mannosidase
MRKTILFATLAFAAAANAQSKRIYIAPDDHTDYMWTGDEEAYRKAYLEMLDYYLELADKTQGNPPEYQSRWHADGSLWLWTYERNKTPAEFRRLMDRVRDGHISFPLNALVSTYGGTPTEAVLRGMYYAGSLERRFGLRIPLAIAMEDQTLPYGLGGLWAGSGAKYSWKGICGCLTQLNPARRRPHEIYWWKADDGSRILMKWNSMRGDAGNRGLGGYAEARTPAKEIEYVDHDADFRKRYPYPVIGIFGKGWDDLKTLSNEFVTVAQAETTPQRQIIVSNINDFFVDFEKSYGKTLPEFSGSFGNEWDLYSASLTEVSARVRRTVEKLRGAEALASMVSLRTPGFMQPRRAARDLAWMDLGLYWEHNWTADGPVISREARAKWERKIAGEIESYVDSLHNDAAYALGGMIRMPAGKRRFYVFNPLGWSRTDAADVVYESADRVHVIDLSSGEETPSQLVWLPEDGYPHGRQYLRIWAKDLPAAGYKVYEVAEGAGRAFSAAAEVQGSVFENSTYRLKVEDRGAISSLADKSRGGREFAGSTQNSRWAINDLGQDPGLLEVENAGPVSVTLKATGESPLAHTTRITMYRDSRRIDIRNDITENFDGTHTWGFAFNLKSPDVRHEEVGAVIRAKYLADGGNYSPVMSRLEWLTLNHFADMSGEDGAGVTLSNRDCAFMKLGNTGIHDGVSYLDSKTPQIQVLAGGQIDAPQAGIPKQGGDKHFLQRFALRTHGLFDATSAMRFALEHQNPPITGWLHGEGDAPETSFSLLTTSNPRVLLWALKPADDDAAAGLIARFWNLSDTPQDYSISLAGGIAKAAHATHIETDLAAIPVESGQVTSRAAAHQIQTLRVVPAGNAGRR